MIQLRVAARQQPLPLIPRGERGLERTGYRIAGQDTVGVAARQQPLPLIPRGERGLERTGYRIAGQDTVKGSS